VAALDRGIKLAGDDVEDTRAIACKTELMMRLGRCGKETLCSLDHMCCLGRKNAAIKAEVSIWFPTFIDYYLPDDLYEAAKDYPNVMWAFRAIGANVSEQQTKDIDGSRPSLNNCCLYCFKVLAKLQTCSQCKTAVYCGAECQRGHWKEHKKSCKKK
jgi:hypothetical protein